MFSNLSDCLPEEKEDNKPTIVANSAIIFYSSNVRVKIPSYLSSLLNSIIGIKGLA